LTILRATHKIIIAGIVVDVDLDSDSIGSLDPELNPVSESGPKIHPPPPPRKDDELHGLKSCMFFLKGFYFFFHERLKKKIKKYLHTCSFIFISPNKNPV
jgi:hypothetical protein